VDGLPLPLRGPLDQQDGLLSRAQLVDLGFGDHDLRRWRRRRLLVPVHPGVYVDHTGTLTWHQRAWAAVLSVSPAALFGCCALTGDPGPGWREHDDAGPLHVVVESHRRIAAPPHVAAHRVTGLDHRVQWLRSPPRMRVEEAVVDAASRAADDLAAIQVVAAAVGSRSTTAARLLEALSRRGRVARRTFLEGVLRDVGEGACSVLEVAYLRDVERAHGLPRGRRQAPRGDRPGLRDVLYVAEAVAVELDGRLDHAGTRERDADLERDLAALAEGLTTARVGWSQAARHPCRTARAIAVLLRRHGWVGEIHPCPRCS
jgi:very-short-patch-repair endonuclease